MILIDLSLLHLCGQREMDERENAKLDFDSAVRKVRLLLKCASPLTRRMLSVAVAVCVCVLGTNVVATLSLLQLRLAKQRGQAEAIVRRDVKVRASPPTIICSVKLTCALSLDART